MESFVQRVKFCYKSEHDKIQDECVNNWESNFDLFGGTDNSSSVVAFYNYYCRGTIKKRSSILFLNIPNLDDDSCKCGSPKVILLPGNFCILSLWSAYICKRISLLLSFVLTWLNDVAWRVKIKQKIIRKWKKQKKNNVLKSPNA